MSHCGKVTKWSMMNNNVFLFFFQAEDGIRYYKVTGVQTCALPISATPGEGRVRAVSMLPTDGMVRGMNATDTGGPITVPVGEGTLGRVMNVIGEPVDNLEIGRASCRERMWREADHVTLVEITIREN